MPRVISSNGFTASSHVAAAAPAPTVTSRRCEVKPTIETSIVHTPSASSARRYAPCTSVVVVSVVLPCVAVTRAPGTGDPPANVTRPT